MGKRRNPFAHFLYAWYTLEDWIFPSRISNTSAIIMSSSPWTVLRYSMKILCSFAVSVFTSYRKEGKRWNASAHHAFSADCPSIQPPVSGFLNFNLGLKCLAFSAYKLISSSSCFVLKHSNQRFAISSCVTIILILVFKGTEMTLIETWPGLKIFFQ